MYLFIFIFSCLCLFLFNLYLSWDFLFRPAISASNGSPSRKRHSSIMYSMATGHASAGRGWTRTLTLRCPLMKTMKSTRAWTWVWMKFSKKDAMRQSALPIMRSYRRATGAQKENPRRSWRRWKRFSHLYQRSGTAAAALLMGPGHQKLLRLQQPQLLVPSVPRQTKRSKHQKSNQRLLVDLRYAALLGYIFLELF